MVKGVNKQIIEINDTGNKYFERVLLFVTPGKKELPEQQLQARAREYLANISDGISPIPSLREQVNRKRTRRKTFIISGVFALIAVAAVLILNIL